MPRIPRFLYVVVSVLLVAPPGLAQEHVVTPKDADERLVAAAVARIEDLRTLDRMLSSPVGRRAAEVLQADVGRVRASFAALSDQELADLALRAEALTLDPVAGANPGLVILAVLGAVLIILVILYAISCSGDAWC